MPSYPIDAVLPYGPLSEQVADLRRPQGPPRGTVLLLHGGFWRQEWDRHHTDVLAADLAGRGLVVASLEYRRLGGEGGWPGTFDDVAAAMDVLPGRLAEVLPELSAAPMALLGHSAGGHLALWAAGRHRLPPGSPWELPAPAALAGVVALAPVADLGRAVELGLDDGAAVELLGGPPTLEADPLGADRLEADRLVVEQLLAERLAQADPLRLPPATRVRLVHGDRDRHVPLDLSRRYEAAVRAAGTDIHLDVLQEVEHFALIEPGSGAWPRVLAALEAALGTSLATPGA